MTAPIRVLYIDDERDLLELGKLYLEQSGEFIVTTVQSAPEALRILELKKFDATISDYQMPEMDGIQFLKVVRSRGDKTPFIIFTGRGREDVVIEALNAGADFYLQKVGEPRSQFAELAHKIRHAVMQRQADVSIRDHERREAEIINFLPDATFAIDTRGVVIAWNRAIEEMTGVPAAEMLGKGNYEYALPFYHERRPILIDLVLNNDPAMVARYPYVKRDGNTLISETTIPHFNNGRGAVVWFIASPLYDNRGTVVGVIESIREITDRKQVEDSLSESEERFRNISDLIPDFAYSCRMTPDRVFAIDWITGAPEQTTGYTIDEIKEMTCWKFLVIDEDIPVFEKNVTGLLLEESARCELRIRKKDGGIIWLTSFAKCVPDPKDPAHLRLYGGCQDITVRKQAEKAIKEREAMLNIAQRVAHLGSWDMDVKTGQLIWSDELFRIMGYAPQSFNPLYDSLDKIVHPDDLGPMKAAVANAIAGKTPFECVLRVVLPDGRIRILLDQAETQYDNSGNPVRMIGTALDITDRTLAEEALREGEARYRTLIENLPQKVFMKDLNSRYVSINEKFAQDLGIHPDEIVGKSDADFFPPELAAKYRADDITIMETNTPEEFDERYLREGKETWVHTIKTVVKDNNGKVSGVCGVFWDITDKKMVEELFREVFNNANDAIFLHEMTPDGLGKYILVNDRATQSLGYTRDEFLRMTPADIVPKAILQKLLPFTIPQMRTAGHATFESIHIRKDGSEFPVEVSTHTFPFKGRTVGLSIVRDITERKQAEKMLRESDAKSRLLLERLPELILVHRNGIILYTNPAAAKTLGYQPHEVLNRQVKDFIAPEFYELVAAAIRQRMNGEPVVVYELEVIGRDGNRRDMVVNGSMIEFDGAPASLIVLTDITLRKKVEDDLKKSEQRYKAIVEDQTEFICRFTQDGRLTFVNDAYCRYFGLDKTRCLKSPHTVKLTPEDAQLMREHLASLTPKNPIAFIEHRIIMPTGEIRWQRWNDRAIFDRNGTVIEYQSVGRDITGQKRIETELQSTKRRLADIINWLPDPTIVIDTTGTVTAWNHAMLSLIHI